ncbi:hypothetical protein EAH89_24560 [Roseomonas nepalensis]|uniref:4-oxalocrotonate decarboxylase n=1 Tax=Muricoccus nepalensis TaxID=1854500 RepID=A0A502FAS1_9PROT|nr:hypothetical protein [Roseomonas nepalensis]TPG46487.1 hypothetical protein EAH89_24560 [Roseomonas nepalensis]
MPRRTRADRAAGWLAEAIATGSPLAPLSADAAPRSRAEGERAALLALAELGLAPCGLRTLGGLAGPMVGGRLLPDGASVLGVRHPVATAALVAVLAEPLEEGETAPPVLSAVHPALDVAGSRFTTAPAAAALRAADLAGLGMVVAGPAAPPPADGVMIETAAGARRTDASSAFLAAAAAARRLGGLPAGALLVVAGLSEPIAPDADGRISAGFGALGRVGAQIL